MTLQLETGLEPLQIIREKVLLTFWDHSQRVNYNYEQITGLIKDSIYERFKTKSTPLTHVQELKKKYNIPYHLPAPMVLTSMVQDCLPTPRLALLEHSKIGIIRLTEDRSPGLRVKDKLR